MSEKRSTSEMGTLVIVIGSGMGLVVGMFAGQAADNPIPMVAGPLLGFVIGAIGALIIRREEKG